MSIYYKVKIDSGTAAGPYTIYHTQINSSNIATLYSNAQPAVNVTYTSLNSGDGVLVIVPDNTTRVILYNQECDTYEDNLVTYNISAASSNVNEGSSITLNVTTRNVPNNTVLYWTINYNSSSSDPDFFTAVTGTTTIVNKVSTFSVSLESDLATEGSETFYVELRTGSLTGTIVDSTDVITINDTSRYYYYLVKQTYNCEPIGNPYAYYKVQSDYGENKLVKVNGVGDNMYLMRNEFNQNNGDNVAFVDVTNCVKGTPTYSITASTNTISEGGTVTFAINTTYVMDGTRLYWKINYNNSSSSNDFSFTDGTFVISNGSGSVSTAIVNDLQTEGAETFYAELRKESINGAILATSGVITINDTSTSPPTYAISTPSSVNEGSTANFNVTTTNVANGTILYWRVLFNGETDSNDFTSNIGTVTINNNSGLIGVGIRNDNTTEGLESFKVELRTDSIRGDIKATSNDVTINDTSIYPTVEFTYSQTCIGTSNTSGRVTFTNVTGGSGGPYEVTINGTNWYSWTGSSFRIDGIADGTHNLRARDNIFNYSAISTITVDCYRAPIYSIAAVGGVTSVNESSAISFAVSTTYVPNGTTLYWSIDTNNSTSASDFNPTSGSVTVNNGSGTISIGIIGDNLTEGPQTFRAQLRTGSVSGNIVATSGVITINDTSINTVPNWQYAGFTTCVSCQNVTVYKDENPNSTTYNYYRIGTDGSAQPNQPTGIPCNTSAVWENNGSYGCYGTCGKYYVQTDTNPCSITSQSTRQGDLVPGESNSTFCYNGSNCCGQSTTPNWVNSGSPYCQNGYQYQLKTDNNPCSSTHTATDAVPTGDNSQCWQLSDVYYTSCANANSASEPYQSYVLNGTYKYTTYNVSGNWENLGTFMTGDWFFVDSTGAHRRTFYSGDNLELLGTIVTTDLSECTTGGGGTDPEQLG